MILCLFDYNYELLRPVKPVDGYLSPFFENYVFPTRPRPHEKTEIAVQGIISFDRREYEMLIDVCRYWKTLPDQFSVVFNIVGDLEARDGPKLRRMIVEEGLQRFFKLHSWLPDRDFFQAVQQADYVMPLVSGRKGPYLSGGKVSLAYGHSGAYGKPMILHRDVASRWGVPEDLCVTYSSPESLADQLSRLTRDPDRVARYRQWIAGKIETNKSFLRRLAETHSAFASIR